MAPQGSTLDYPKENYLYSALFGLNEVKTRAELSHMPEVVGLSENDQPIVNYNEDEGGEVAVLKYFIIDPKEKNIDLDEIRAASVYWWPEIAIVSLVIYLVLQYDYSIAETSRAYFNFFFGLLNTHHLTETFVKIAVYFLLLGTGITVITSKALNVIHLPRRVDSWAQETLLRTIKEFSLKIKDEQNQKTLLLVLAREEYLQEIEKNIDFKYSFIYTAYLIAQENNVRLVFAIANSYSLDLGKIVEKIQKNITGTLFILPYSALYHKDPLAKQHPCPYNSRRIFSHSEFIPTIEYKKLICEAIFFAYITSFNYLFTTIVSICQAYVTLTIIAGINENSSAPTQGGAILGGIFIGGIRSWVAIYSNKEDAEKYLRASSFSLLTSIQTYALDPIKIICDPLTALVEIGKTVCHIWPRSRQELWVRLQQLNQIQLGIGAELATHFMYASNTLFFFDDTAIIWGKLLLQTEFSSKTLFTLSLLAAFAQVSLYSMSQGFAARQKYFAEARALETKIDHARENSRSYTESQLPSFQAEKKLCASIWAYIQSIPLVFYNKNRSWRNFWLAFFMVADSFNVSCTASTGAINVMRLYNPSMPAWKVVLFSSIAGMYMYRSQAAYNEENIDKGIKFFEKLFFCHADGPNHSTSGRYSHILSFFNSTEKRSQESSQCLEMLSIDLVAEENINPILSDRSSDEGLYIFNSQATPS